MTALRQVAAPEDFHGGLSVGVVGWLEAQLLQAQPVKEHLQRANEIPQSQPSVAYHTCTDSPPYASPIPSRPCA